VEFTKLGMEIAEAQIKDMWEMNRDDTFLMMRVNKTLIGITDDVNRANAYENRQVWLENIIKPKADRFIDHANAFLIDDWGKGNLIGYEDPSQERIQDKLEEWKEGHNKWLSTNDSRRERNLPHVKGGDVMYIPFSQVAMGDSRDSGDGGGQSGEKQLKLKKKAFSDPDSIEAYRIAFYGLESAWEGIVEESVKKVFDKQEREILNRNRKVFDEWLFDPQESKKIWLEVLGPVLYELTDDIAQFVLESIGDDQTEFELTQAIRAYINDRVSRMADGVDADTLKQLQETILEGIQQGESVSKMRK